ncbi:hypothetical protein VI817_007864 [Penicillium citrinum]|nr:hypothetical protein VI817_007864 [Penicillium citrinum]
MSSERRSQNTHLPSSSVADVCNQIIAQYFKPSGQTLSYIVDLLESYQTVLDSDVNFAQLFGVPLASDSKAAALNLLFSKEKPQVVRVGKSSNHDINWTDVLRSTPYDATLQENGNYHVQIEKGDALIEVTKEDHDFILTEIPHQLINPHSYPGDIALETSALKSVIDQLTFWQDSASRCESLTYSPVSDVSCDY